MKIVSLIPSGTDLVASLGLGDALVGISHECDHPIALGKPVLTQSAIRKTTPQEIDQQVTQAVSQGISLYQTNREALYRIAPDFIITQDICDVCAVSRVEVQKNLPPHSQLISLSATSVNGLKADLLQLGEAFGVVSRAREQIQSLTIRLEAIREKARSLPQKKVLALEWLEPPFLGGHWVPELIEWVGGISLLARPGEASRRASREEIFKTEPQVVCALPCGYSLAEVQSEVALMASEQKFQEWYRRTPFELWSVHANALFSRCTLALVEAAEVLAGILHPQTFPPVSPTAGVRFSFSS